MADDGWSGRSHADIVAKLSALKADHAYDLGNTWTDMYTKLSDAGDKLDLARRKLATEGFWTGKGPAAALRTLSTRVTEFDNSESGTPALAGKMSNALAQDGEVLTSAHHVAQAHPELGSGAPTERKKEELEAIRIEAQRLYTAPLEAKRPEITDNAGQPMSGPMPQGPGANNSSRSGGGGGEKLQSPSGAEGLASKDTKPQLAGGEGQQGGAGQGQGAGQGGGQGAGSGGGTPGGGQGPGGLGSGGRDSATGLPLGSTTAAGFSPSATGTGAGVGSGGPGAPGGVSGLRGGGLPGGAAGGTGPGNVNPAGIGAAGVRNIGGPMGMMGGAGAHGRGGKDNDDEHQMPDFLRNLDNSERLLGDQTAVIPGGVIGNFEAVEDDKKRALEAEKRRFKSIGWDVKFSDEDDDKNGTNK